MKPPAPADRVNEIVGRLRPAQPKAQPESLTAAATSGNLVAMQLFLDRGANLEQRSAGFATPLTAACAAGHVEAARWLINHGAKLDPPGVLLGPVNAACSTGNGAMIALLLDAGLPVEHAAWGVIAAATMGNLPMIRWLVGRGVELDRTYERIGVLREKARWDAERNGHADVESFLRSGYVPSDPAPSEPPIGRHSPSLSREGPRAREDERAALVAEGVQLIAAAGKAAGRWVSRLPRASGGELLVSHAARHGVTELVAAFLDAGVDPDEVEPGTPPPLYRAADSAELETVHLLLARGANPNGLDRKSWLPLLAAVSAGEPEGVRILLAAGASPKAKPAGGGGTLADQARGPYATEIRALLEIPAGPSRAKAKRA